MLKLVLLYSKDVVSLNLEKKSCAYTVRKELSIDTTLADPNYLRTLPLRLYIFLTHSCKVSRFF
jgi:hypothetical protein